MADKLRYSFELLQIDSRMDFRLIEYQFGRRQFGDHFNCAENCDHFGSVRLCPNGRIESVQISSVNSMKSILLKLNSFGNSSFSKMISGWKIIQLFGHLRIKIISIRFSMTKWSFLVTHVSVFQ